MQPSDVIDIWESIHWPIAKMWRHDFERREDVQVVALYTRPQVEEALTKHRPFKDARKYLEANFPAPPGLPPARDTKRSRQLPKPAPIAKPRPQPETALVSEFDPPTTPERPPKPAPRGRTGEPGRRSRKARRRYDRELQLAIDRVEQALRERRRTKQPRSPKEPPETAQQARARRKDERGERALDWQKTQQGVTPTKRQPLSEHLRAIPTAEKHPRSQPSKPRDGRTLSSNPIPPLDATLHKKIGRLQSPDDDT